MSETAHTLSLFAAIFININIMLGSGIFINSTLLAQYSGTLGFLAYLLVGILMLPLIFSISRLTSLYSAGGFYTFGSQISPLVGFVSSWSYIIGKLGSASVITNIATLLLQYTIPSLNSVNTLVLNATIMAIFILLNTFDIRTGKTIQACFFFFKTIPIFFGICAGIFLFSSAHLQPQINQLTHIPVTIPLVVFAIAGFEAACSLSIKIKNASTNAPRAILISYGFVILTLTLFQFMISGALGGELATLADYRSLFPAIVQHALPTYPGMHHIIITIIHLAIAASALGGSYGIIFSNNWNLYTLAQQGHLFASNRLTKLNRYAIPWLCVISEGIIYLLFLIVSRGNQIPLQQIGALGPTIAYTLSAWALYAITKRNTHTVARWVPVCAIISCLLLISTTIYGFFIRGMSSLLLFGLLLLIGLIMFLTTRSRSSSYFDRNKCHEA